MLPTFVSYILNTLIFFILYSQTSLTYNNNNKYIIGFMAFLVSIHDKIQYFTKSHNFKQHNSEILRYFEFYFRKSKFTVQASYEIPILIIILECHLISTNTIQQWNLLNKMTYNFLVVLLAIFKLLFSLQKMLYAVFLILRLQKYKCIHSHIQMYLK